MKRVLCLFAGLCLLPLSIPSCGYHLGGVISAKMEGVKSVAVEMFANDTEYPIAGALQTTAITNALQTDGAFELLSPTTADAVITGSVSGVDISRSLVDWRDSNLSLEFRITVHVSYKVTRKSDGKVLAQGSASGSGTYYNTGGNTQAGRDAAISYGTRRAAEAIVAALTCA